MTVPTNANVDKEGVLETESEDKNYLPFQLYFCFFTIIYILFKLETTNLFNSVIFGAYSLLKNYSKRYEVFNALFMNY